MALGCDDTFRTKSCLYIDMSSDNKLPLWVIGVETTKTWSERALRETYFGQVTDSGSVGSCRV